MAASSPSTKLRNELLPYQIVIGVAAASIGGIVAILGELRDELGFEDSEIGVLVTAGFLAAFLAQVTLARYADRGYGRQMATAGVALSAAALLTMVVADDIVTWTLARGALGFAGGLIMPGLRRAATVLDPERVGENLGRLIVGEVTGFLIGPMLSALLVEVGDIRTPFLVMGLGMVLFLPVVWRLPPDRGEIDEARRSSYDLLRIRRLQGALLVIFGYFSLIGAWESVMPVMFKDRGGGSMETAIAFTLLAVPILFLSPLAGRTADRVGPPRIAVAGMAVVALGTTTFGLLPGLIYPVILMVIFGIADAFAFTAGQVAVSRAVPEQRQAAALGLMGAVEVLGAALTALPAALIYDSHGEKAAWIASGLFAFAVVMVGATRFRGTEPANQATPEIDKTL